MDVKKLYEEQMKKYFDVSNAVRDAVYVVFPPSKNATIDDLYHARQLAEKVEESKKLVDDLLRAKNLAVNGQKQRTVRNAPSTS